MEEKRQLNCRLIAELDAIFEAECPDDRQIVVDYFIDEFLPQFLDTLEELLKSNDGHFLAGDNVSETIFATER